MIVMIRHAPVSPILKFYPLQPDAVNNSREPHNAFGPAFSPNARSMPRAVE